MAQIGIYEKALPKDLSWKERFALVKDMGFDFIELSIDETDERLARLNWTEKEIQTLRNEMFEADVRINSICLSAHRRFPLAPVIWKNSEWLTRSCKKRFIWRIS